jgi:predicted extracellular nuclease
MHTAQEFAEGSSFNKYLEIYNAGSCLARLDEYAIANVVNAPASPGVHEEWKEFAAGATLAPGDVYVMAHPQADAVILSKADETNSNLQFNGDDGYCLAKGSSSTYTKVDCIGNFEADPGSAWDVCGTKGGTADHTLRRKATATAGNGGDWITSAGSSPSDCEWAVLPKDEWKFLGSHSQATSE